MNIVNPQTVAGVLIIAVITISLMFHDMGVGWTREVYGGQGSPRTLEVDFECDKGKVYRTALHDFSPAIQAATFCLYGYLLCILLYKPGSHISSMTENGNNLLLASFLVVYLVV